MAVRVVQGAAGVEPQQWRAGAAALVASQYRRQVWEDMLMVMEKLGMPISDKQRGFFRPRA